MFPPLNRRSTSAQWANKRLSVALSEVSRFHTSIGMLSHFYSFSSFLPLISCQAAFFSLTKWPLVLYLPRRCAPHPLETTGVSCLLQSYPVSGRQVTVKCVAWSWGTHLACDRLFGSRAFICDLFQCHFWSCALPLRKPVMKPNSLCCLLLTFLWSKCRVFGAADFKQMYHPAAILEPSKLSFAMRRASGIDFRDNCAVFLSLLTPCYWEISHLVSASKLVSMSCLVC